MARATLTISSKNYSSWSLRGWLLCRMAGLDFEERPVDLADPGARQELLLLSPSVLVPRLTHDDVDGLGHAGDRRISQRDRAGGGAAGRPIAAARAHCRAVSGEMHSGFYNLRSALPMNLKARHEASRSSPARGPTSSGSRRSGPNASRPTAARSCSARRRVADAMYAPVCTRFRTYAVDLDAPLQAYCDTIFDWPLMEEWTAGALAEPDEIVELDVEF